MNTSTYSAYFRNLAIKHTLLRHDPLSEQGSAPGKKHFFRFSTDEIITGLRSKINFPALGLELYEKTTGNNVKGTYDGAFSVLCTADAEDYSAVEEAYDISEKILHDILAKIYQDHYGPITSRCGTPFQFFDFDNLKIMSMGPVFDSQFGWRCEFSFRMYKEYSITTPPVEGLFLV